MMITIHIALWATCTWYATVVRQQCNLRHVQCTPTPHPHTAAAAAAARGSDSAVCVFSIYYLVPGIYYSCCSTYLLSHSIVVTHSLETSIDVIVQPQQHIQVLIVRVGRTTIIDPRYQV